MVLQDGVLQKATVKRCPWQDGASVLDPWEVAKVEPLAPPVLLRWWRWLRSRPAGVLVMGGRLSELVRSCPGRAD